MRGVIIFFREVLTIVIVALAIVIPIRYFLFQPFLVVGESMEPTFFSGNYLIVDQLSYRFRQPQRGEVIVFKYPGMPSQRYIKRIIGLPGETVEIKNGQVAIFNDKGSQLLDESIYLPSTSLTLGNDRWVLGDKEYFVMGDNRPYSSDSRRWGALPREDIIGRVFLRIWPFAAFAKFEAANLRLLNFKSKYFCAKKNKFKSPSGMHDILAEEQKYFQRIFNICQDLAIFYQFEKIDTPILEDSELFSKGIGLATDIVGSQMFNLKTKGGGLLSLRPEGTASVARAYIENGMFNLPQPVKLWYFGPFFRYEHPQLGRYRQFWQAGFEIFGEEGPVVDAQIIQIFYNVLKELKIKNLLVEINSIGDSQCRPYYKKILVSYFKSREGSLCSDCKRRLRENPLRILDCKEEKCQQVRAQAPQILDHLCEECRRHFKEVLEFLDEIELPYHLNPYLVRGLDYYTKTVFEIVEDSEEGKKIGSLTGGGRYDNLVKILGGKPTPACGGAAGIERIIAIMREKR